MALFVGVCCISFAAVFFRKAAPTHPLASAGLRLAVAAVLLLPFVIRARLKGTLSRRLVGSAIVAGAFYGLHFGSWVASLDLTSVAASVTLVTSTPLLLAIVSLATGRDRPDRRLWFAIVLATVGVAVIGAHDVSTSESSLAGDLLALLGAGAMVGYLLTGRRLGDDMDVWVFSGIACGVGAALLLAVALASGVSLAPASADALLFIVLAALVPQLVGHTALTWSLRYTRPTVVGMATVGEPVGATFLGWVWLGEGVSTPVLVGSVVTITAVVVAIREPRPPGRQDRGVRDPRP